MVDFKKADNELSIIEFCKQHGYREVRDETCRSHVVLCDRMDNDKIIVSTKGNKERYYTHQKTGYSNGLVHFIKTRRAKFCTPTQNEWADVTGILEKYMNMPSGYATRSCPSESEIPFNPDRYRLTTVRDFTYLNSRGLETDFLQAKSFRGRIYNNVYNNETYTLFPVIDPEGKIKGLDIRRAGYKRMASDSDLSNAMWRTRIDFKKAVPEIIIGESPIDALSLARIRFKTADTFDEANIELISLNGSVRQCIIRHIQKMMEKYPGIAITCAMDNDYGGFMHDLSMIKHLIPQSKIIKEQVNPKALEHIIHYRDRVFTVKNDKNSYHEFLTSMEIYPIRLSKPQLKDWNQELQNINVGNANNQEKKIKTLTL